MTINATYLAKTTRSSKNWQDAKSRVLCAYRSWLRAAPEIQSMYSLNVNVSQIRTKTRQEFERHRYVNSMKTVDVLLFHADSELQETLNYWKQLNHVMKYFPASDDPKTKLPNNFMAGFLQGRN